MAPKKRERPPSSSSSPEKHVVNADVEKHVVTYLPPMGPQFPPPHFGDRGFPLDVYGYEILPEESDDSQKEWSTPEYGYFSSGENYVSPEKKYVSTDYPCCMCNMWIKCKEDVIRCWEGECNTYWHPECYKEGYDVWPEKDCYCPHTHTKNAEGEKLDMWSIVKEEDTEHTFTMLEYKFTPPRLPQDFHSPSHDNN